MIAEAHRIPLAASLTGGNRNDVTQLMPLIAAIPPVGGRRGRPRKRPDALCADRGYDHDKYRRQVRQAGIAPVIARPWHGAWFWPGRAPLGDRAVHRAYFALAAASGFSRPPSTDRQPPRAGGSAAASTWGTADWRACAPSPWPAAPNHRPRRLGTQAPLAGGHRFKDPSLDRCLRLQLAEVFVMQLLARSSVNSLIGSLGLEASGSRSVSWWRSAEKGGSVGRCPAAGELRPCRDAR